MAALYKSIFPSQTPKVSLLNIGSEEIKGTEILKNSFNFKKINNQDNFLFNGYIKNELMDGNLM